MLFVLYGATLDMGYESRRIFREEGFEIINKYNYVADDAKVDKDKYVNAAQDENYAKWYDDKIYVEYEKLLECDFRYGLDGVYLGFDQQQIMDAIHGVKNCLLTIGSSSLELVLQLKRAYGNYVTIINIFEDYEAVMHSVEMGNSVSEREKETRIEANLKMQRLYLENTDAFDEVVIYTLGSDVYNLEALRSQYQSIIRRRAEIERSLNSQKYVSLPYEGTEPYLFVSYAHADKEKVFATLAGLQRNSIRIWYDDGIHGGTNWRRILSQKIMAAAGVLIFCSDASMKSDNVVMEFELADDLKKPFFPVKLDDAPLEPEFRFVLGRKQIIDYTAPDFEKRLVAALPDAVKIQ